jgi:hypothetical protein
LQSALSMDGFTEFPNSEEWLSDLRKTYTMEDQHHQRRSN